MEYYLAPMEGITTHIYRNAYHKYFRPMDKYFTPFLVPHSKKGFSQKEIRETAPENNRGLRLVPQILSNHGEDTLNTIRKLEQYGYEEVNLNFGCPSRTVVSKYRGSGFLAKPEELNRYLDEVCAGTRIRISVKTRIGRDSPEEFFRLLDIYNQYPLEELIIHPRTQKDFYGNTPNLEMFAYAVEESRLSLCYNGDIFLPRDCEKLCRKFPEVSRIMAGRGIIADPFLTERIEGGRRKRPTGAGDADGALDGQGRGDGWKRLRRFHDEVYYGYREISSGDLPALFKMKEIWTYMLKLFPENKKAAKKIKKAEKHEDYQNAVEELFSRPFSPEL